MRLRDLTNRGERESAPLDDQVQAELDALDAALAGEDVPAGMEGLATLVGELRAERPQATPDFGARLDAWREAGFRRDERPGSRSAGIPVELDPAAPPAGPSRSPATFLVVGAVAVTQIDNGGGGVTPAVPQVVESDGAGVAAGGTAPSLDRGLTETSQWLGKSATGDIAAGTPSLPAAARAFDRKVDRDASLTLGAGPDNVQDVMNDSIGVVEHYGGVVLSSNISGSKESATAQLDLQVPSKNLDATLGDLRGLADVLSYSDGQVDITAPFVDTKDKLQGLRAERRSVLTRIEQATTQEDVDNLKIQLNGLNHKIASAQSDLDKLQHRANQSSVSLTITSDGARDTGGDGGWSFSDSLDDAGHVLTVAAGVALISAAVLLPLALIAAILYLAISRVNRRSRERALD